MALTFADKLDFLMKLTNTQNSSLARILNFDASYISRIRSGKRGIPRSADFILAVSAYFAKTITEPYQMRAAADAILPGMDWSATQSDAAALLADWLTREDARSAGDPVARFLQRLSSAEDMPQGAIPAQARPERAERVQCFYGNEGKRAGVDAILSAMCSDGGARQLLLFSEEEMSWLYEDADFAQRWFARMCALLRGGVCVRIIHTVNRDAREMLEAIRRWLPLYMMGAVDPWYYPGHRDNVFRRTLFIARDCCAMTSSSVGAHTSGALNLVLRDPAAVAALQAEFEHYFALCRPLMEIDTAPELPKLLARLDILTAHGATAYFSAAVRDAGAAQEGELQRALHRFAHESAACRRVCSAAIPRNVLIFLTEQGVMVLRTDGQGVCFLIREPHMCAAFRDYLRNILPEVPGRPGHGRQDGADAT